MFVFVFQNEKFCEIKETLLKDLTFRDHLAKRGLEENDKKRRPNQMQAKLDKNALLVYFLT